MRYLTILLLFSSALAHRVNIFAYVEGEAVVAKGYYSDGSPVRNGRVTVYDAKGEKLLSGKTDGDGIFSFPVSVRTDLKIVLNAGLGHKAETEIRKADLPEAKSFTRSAKKEPRGMSEEELRRIVAEVIDEKLHPLFNLIARERSKRFPITEVIGGIGYIVGIMGLIVYFRSRRKIG